MGVGEPKVTQSVVKSLASSGPFEKIIKNWKFFEILHVKDTEKNDSVTFKSRSKSGNFRHF